MINTEQSRARAADMELKKLNGFIKSEEASQVRRTVALRVVSLALTALVLAFLSYNLLGFALQ